MADASIEVRGFAELAAGTRQLAANIQDAAGTQFGQVADQVAAQVAGSVPRLTGALAASVEGRPIPGGASASMGDGVPYAEFVEYGGRGHPHSPTGNYLYPAAQDAEPAIVAAAERAANTEIGAMSWPSPS